MGLLSGLFGSSSKASSSANTTSSTTNQADNRVVLGNDAVQVGAAGFYSTASNSGNTTSTAFNVDDSSSRDYSTHYTGTDGGAVQIAKFNADLLSSVSSNQGDTVRLLSQMGADGISRQAEAATDLFATASKGAEASWSHTIDKSGELIDKLLQTAQGTVAGANAIASQAVSSFTPTDNKNSDVFKYAAIAAGLLIAYKVFKG